ncbi:MAG: NosD domain-containing protein [Candidatus Thorarchaeota archaeon]
MSLRTIIALLLSISLLGASSVPIYMSTTVNDYAADQSQRGTLSSNDQIVIESDADFEIQGWPGNGTESNPYILADLHYEVADDLWTCIAIWNTVSHFVIANCSFSSEQDFSVWGITLVGVSNGSIINCTFANLGRGITSNNSTDCIVSKCHFTYSGIGIVQESGKFDFVNNTILHCRTGLILDSANKSSVHGSTFLINRVGADLFGTFGCNLTYNLFAYNTEIGVRIGYLSTKTSLFGNRIAFNQEAQVHEDMNAQDDGCDNLWDDNVSIGNEWGDYSGSGVYEIPGTAGSVDRYPGTADFDIIGPTLYHATDLRVTVMRAPCPFQSIEFHVSVYDQSGVDIVRLYYSSSMNGSWSSVDLEYQPTTQNPDEYSYSFPGPLYSLDFISHYYFWANDTLGQDTTTEMYENWLGCSGFYNPLTNPVVIVVSSGCIAMIILALIIRKYRRP